MSPASVPPPPRFPHWVFARFIPRRDHLLTELSDLYRLHVERNGARAARWWYWGQLGSFAGRLVVDYHLRVWRVVRPDVRSLTVDFGLGLRRLRRRPGYLLSAVLTLGIGVGGLATVYTAANWVLLRPVPGVSDPQGLAMLRIESTSDWSPAGFAWAISDPDLRALDDFMPSLASLGASTGEDVHVSLGADAGARRVPAEAVTGNYFDVLGVQPAWGRFFRPSDHRGTTGPAEVVIGYPLWQGLWRGDPSAVGSTLRVNGRGYTVIGVAPAGFRGAELPGRADIWFAATALPHLRPEESPTLVAERRHQLWGNPIGRMSEGVGIAQVEEEANAAMERIRTEITEGHSFLATHFVIRAYRGPGLSPYVRSSVDRTLQILAAAGALLLVLALANVTNLGLARLASRRTELAIRRALGSGVWRVAREPLLESAAIGIAGAGAGLGIAALGVRLFREASLSSRGASLEGMTLDWRVIVVTAGVGLVAAIVAGITPSLAAAGGAGGIGRRGPIDRSHGTPRFRAAMVVIQVAISAILVVGAGLLTRTAINLQRIDLGFEPQGLVTFSFEPGLEGYEAATQRATVQRVFDRAIAEPTVRAAGLIWPAPLSGWMLTAGFYPAGGDRREDLAIAGGFDATPGLLPTLGVRFVAGTDFPARTSALESDSSLVILSVSAARAAFPDVDPAATIGRIIHTTGDDAPRTIRGIVEDAKIIGVTGDPQPLLFRPIADLSRFTEMTAYARGSFRGESDLIALDAALRETAPDLPLYDVSTAPDRVAALLVERRVLARLGVVVAGTGLFLAAIGLYGVLAYGVTERTREIGVRGALGATPNRILLAVVARGLFTTTIGIGVGVLAAAWLVDLIEARLYGVAPLDPVSFLAGTALLLLAATAASWVPARRAVRISPVVALKQD